MAHDLLSVVTFVIDWNSQPAVFSLGKGGLTLITTLKLSFEQDYYV